MPLRLMVPCPSSWTHCPAYSCSAYRRRYTAAAVVVGRTRSLRRGVGDSAGGRGPSVDDDVDGGQACPGDDGRAAEGQVQGARRAHVCQTAQCMRMRSGRQQAQRRRERLWRQLDEVVVGSLWKATVPANVGRHPGPRRQFDALPEISRHLDLHHDSTAIDSSKRYVGPHNCCSDHALLTTVASKARFSSRAARRFLASKIDAADFSLPKSLQEAFTTECSASTDVLPSIGSHGSETAIQDSIAEDYQEFKRQSTPEPQKSHCRQPADGNA